MRKNYRDKQAFKIKIGPDAPVGWRIFSPLEFFIESLLGFRKFNKCYAESAFKKGDHHFFEKVLECLNVSYEVSKEDQRKIPREGPAVVVANHPMGIIDGVILSVIFRLVRRDIKFLSNYLLRSMPEISDLMIYVDPFDKERSLMNFKALMKALRWVKDKKGMLLLFPAGEVASFDIRKWGVAERDWQASVASMIRSIKAPVLPVFINSSNSIIFQILGLAHPRLRTAMLPRECLKKRNKKVEVRIGASIPFKKIEEFRSDAEMLRYLKMRTCALGYRQKEGEDKGRRAIFAQGSKMKRFEPIAKPQNPLLMEKEIRNLSPEQRLIENQDYLVVVARPRQIPYVLQEIGRLRESTFRLVNEGTGKSVDLDEFDRHYEHLILWNKKKNEPVGSYRIGRTDVIQRQYGIKGFYTSTLYHYDPKYFETIGPAFEVGRSFIRLEHQREYWPLLLLLRGLARLIVAQPKYKILFGVISFSNDYHPVSHQLMVAFLKSHHFRTDLATMVRAKNPFKIKSIKGCDTEAVRAIKDIDELSSLISEVEVKQTGVPILLKTYLKLNGKLLGFNVDRDFSNVTDGLILVDLTQSATKVLERFFTKEEVVELLAYHKK